MKIDFASICIHGGILIRDAMAKMEANRAGILLVVDSEGRLEGVVTDGDMRRAMLSNLNFEQPVETLIEFKKNHGYHSSITAPEGLDSNEYFSLLQKHKVFHLPVVDKKNKVTGIVTLDDFLPNGVFPLQAVVMAGGAGNRLRPLTLDVPKPMLPVGDRPLMEIIIGQLKAAGIRRVHVTTHYKSEKIAEHFQDGNAFGVELSYVKEASPLGTAGALGFLENSKETTLVINGDIFTQVDLRAMLAYHKEHGADMTVAVRRYEARIPYGVVDCDGSKVKRITEKPAVGFLVNAGIYILEPSIQSLITRGQPLNMTDLISRAVSEKKTVVSFPIREHWLDIGEHEDYKKAQEFARQGEASA